MRFFVSLIVLLNLVSACSEQKYKEATEKEKIFYDSLGNLMVKKTGGHLISNLSQAISEGGFINAIDYCQINANSLTKEYWQDNIKITRKALKYRNPKNKSNDAVIKNVMKVYHQATKQGKEIKPVLDFREDSVYYYSPIKTVEFCSNCHGQPAKDINEDVYMKIFNQYPQDKAVDFKTGDFRGMWLVTMPRNLVQK